MSVVCGEAGKDILQSEEVRMPGKVKVRVVAGRGLPVMDRGADTTDAFAEVPPHTSHLTPHTSHLLPHTSHLTPHTSHTMQVKLGDTTYKTEVFRKSLNPAWNSDWFRFDLDDMELQVRVRV